MPTREDYEIALALACEEFARRDPRSQAERAGVTWIPAGQGEGGYAEVPFLGTLYRVQSPSGHVSYREEKGEEPALWERILLLHYINTSDGTPLANEYISFKELREAMLYLPNFEKRAVAPLLGRFGRDPAEIWAGARSIGGSEEALGDFSVKIPAFPRVPVALVFWKGDEEFAPRLTVLFDRTVVRYLPAEDIVLATQMMAYRLIGLAGRRN
jgi:Domain of unknown function (DUF3786)